MLRPVRSKRTKIKKSVWLHSDSLTWKWKTPCFQRNVAFQGTMFHFHVMCSSECNHIGPDRPLATFPSLGRSPRGDRGTSGNRKRQSTWKWKSHLFIEEHGHPFGGMPSTEGVFLSHRSLSRIRKRRWVLMKVHTPRSPLCRDRFQQSAYHPLSW